MVASMVVRPKVCKMLIIAQKPNQKGFVNKKENKS